MKKEIQSIYFDESNDNYYIDHNQGVDIINRKEIRAAIYSEKLTLECESNYGGFFFIYQNFKDHSPFIRNFLNKPFYHFLALLQKVIFLLGIFISLMIIDELECYVFSIKSSFWTIFLCYCYIFTIIFCFLGLILLHFMKIEKKSSSDRNFTIFSTVKNKYTYNSSFLLLHNLFFKKGIKITKKTSSLNYFYFTCQILSLSLFVWFLYYIYDFKILIDILKNIFHFDFRGVKFFPFFDLVRHNYSSHSIIHNQIHFYIKLGYILFFYFSILFYLSINILVYILLNTIVFCDYLISLTVLVFRFLILKQSKFKNEFNFLILKSYDNHQNYSQIAVFHFVSLLILFIVCLILDESLLLVLILLITSLIVHLFYTYLPKIKKQLAIGFDWSSSSSDFIIPNYLRTNRKLSELILNSDPTSKCILQKMNYDFFLGNSVWVEEKLIAGHQISRLSPDDVKIVFDTQFCINYINDLNSEEFKRNIEELKVTKFFPSPDFYRKLASIKITVKLLEGPIIRNLQSLSNLDTLLKLVELELENLKHFNRYILDNNEFATRVLEVNGLALQFLNSRFQFDKHYALKAVKSDGSALQYVDESLRKDREIVIIAVKQNSSALQYVDESLRKDREIVIIAVKQNGSALQYVDESLRKDKEIVIIAVKQNSFAIQFADESLQRDREIVLQAIKKWVDDGLSLKDIKYFLFNKVEESLLKDQEFVLEAVLKSSGFALQYANESLRKDREFVLKAVKKSGSALRYAHESLRKDKEFILKCIKATDGQLVGIDLHLINDVDIKKTLQSYQK